MYTAGARRRPTAPLAQSPISLVKKSLLCSLVVRWIFISDFSDRCLLCVVPSSIAVEVGGGWYAVGAQRMPLKTQRRLHTALCGVTASLPVGKPLGSPPGCPVAFVCVQLSAPVHQPEWAHSRAFMRLRDPGRLDTIS